MSRTAGNAFEGMAVQYLESRGVRVLSRNFAARGGEVDIVGQDGETLIFVKVKARLTPNGPDPGEEITFAKQRKICRAAAVYLAGHGGFDRNVRFDAILIRAGEIEWIRGAFDYVG